MARLTRNNIRAATTSRARLYCPGVHPTRRRAHSCRPRTIDPSRYQCKWSRARPLDRPVHTRTRSVSTTCTLLWFGSSGVHALGPGASVRASRVGLVHLGALVLVVCRQWHMQPDMPAAQIYYAVNLSLLGMMMMILWLTLTKSLSPFGAGIYGSRSRYKKK